MSTQKIEQNKKVSGQKEKSVTLDAKNVLRIKKYTRNFDFRYQAAEEIGISRYTLANIIAKGTCSSDTYTLLLSKKIISNAA